MILEACITHINETSEVHDFKVDQKWGTPLHYITAQILVKIALVVAEVQGVT